jgi:pilus assembly protein Flp/PilA
MTDALNHVFVRLQNVVASLRDREEGQGMVEYALILALVSIVAIGALAILGGKVKTAFETINNAFP